MASARPPSPISRQSFGVAVVIGGGLFAKVVDAPAYRHWMEDVFLLARGRGGGWMASACALLAILITLGCFVPTLSRNVARVGVALGWLASPTWLGVALTSDPAMGFIVGLSLGLLAAFAFGATFDRDGPESMPVALAVAMGACGMFAGIGALSWLGEAVPALSRVGHLVGLPGMAAFGAIFARLGYWIAGRFGSHDDVFKGVIAGLPCGGLCAISLRALQ